MNRKRIKNKSGLTLVEVLVAAAIMAFCLSGLLLSYINLFTLTDVTRAFTMANSGVAQKMEEIKNTAYADITGNSTFDMIAEYQARINSTLGLFDYASGSNFNDYHITGVISITDVSPYTYLKKVGVRAYVRIRNRAMWEDANGDGVADPDERTSVELVTYIGNYTSGNSTN
ncbi:MAG: prepilin-type N-terminal cleavage/methylation domain-containing protein [Candidatus Omnitrophota bacterium]